MSDDGEREVVGVKRQAMQDSPIYMIWGISREYVIFVEQGTVLCR